MRAWPIYLAFPMVVGFGVFEGLWSDRWQVSARLEEAVARMQTLPLSVNDWEGQTRTLQPWQIAKGEIAGYRMQQFLHRPTDANLTVLLLCGRPGPMSVHTPEICYAAAGFTQLGPARKRSVVIDNPVGPAEFWVATFRKGGPAPEIIEIYWSWSADGTWSVPREPRFTFARAGALHKLYVIRPVGSLGEDRKEDQSPEFLKVYLPQVQRSLFAVSS